MGLRWGPKGLWDRFWVDVRGFCEGFGRVLVEFGEDFHNCSTLGGFREGFWSLTDLPFWDNLE